MSTTQAPSQRHTLRWILLSVLGVLLLLCVIGTITAACSGSSKKSTPPAATTTTSVTTTKAPAAPKALRDGKFEFTVGAITYGEKIEFASPPQGQYVSVVLTVRNIGDKSQTLFDINQYAYDAQKRKYSANSGAGIYLNQGTNSSVWIDPINPGNTVTGKVVFDIPTTVRITTLELHDSAFSNGVKVNVQS